MPVSSLSVFFPAYNEEKNIEDTVKKAVNVIKELKLDKWEIIIVNDGSKDKTGEVADNLSQNISNVRVVHQLNGGYGMAVRGGFYNSKYDWIVYTDSDGQFDFSEINKFLELTDQADAIWGYRIKRQDPLFRLLNAQGWKLALWIFFGLSLQDVDCGFKMIKKEIIDKIPKLESTRGGMVNAELAIKAKKYGFKIAQVGVNHYPRIHGKPTGANIRVIIQSFIDLFKLWLKLR
ncbi:hypothetical protein A3C32_02295 [Candidatus Daviesbacteria bacterium RIFCSPHIGHO2_02_FULL_41_14]|uniref:Glycosyltransferase 2-like domain-containing protein n=1 Tax=Candidatus Daviesbacteria bacterium RIFCSPLOWO2_01_FULL_40_24 TaxID=1797787 RepID=A0A1F5MK92_9BACT|nr:MAG: hypothetical protein A2780_01420 [Candidatus Daviesbacteria bacterium RIFCSPHIGHO2_01_FULL_41_45]OGE35130.1 MAG: hypothetical protein A3C32_02295 [Candidatus Daviesbacteria bacterium RIFCSPHIGHO2_02_FULL_41_14]OGE65794.1 MAG: hypothetical protein A3B49_01610 [Candidatus Daviesbacteria bacterium RIFCSPLOWO2_01_FULL_40_24]